MHVIYVMHENVTVYDLGQTVEQKVVETPLTQQARIQAQRMPQNPQRITAGTFFTTHYFLVQILIPFQFLIPVLLKIQHRILKISNIEKIYIFPLLMNFNKSPQCHCRN